MNLAMNQILKGENIALLNAKANKNPAVRRGFCKCEKRFQKQVNLREIRGASEACDQNVCLYIAEANERSNEEVFQI